MKPQRWLSWLSAWLLLATLVAGGVHAHETGGAPHDHDCVACKLAHAPRVTADDSPALRLPEPSRASVAEHPTLEYASTPCATPATRAPPPA